MSEKIASTAIISKNSEIGRNVTIGHYSIIHSNTRIADNSIIGSFCEIGLPNDNSNLKFTNICNNTLIRSHNVIYQGTELGQNVSTGHHVTIRENSKIGEHVQIGTLSDIQGDCLIDNYTKVHSNVHISKGTSIGEYVWIFPYVVITNDPHPPSNIRLACEVQDFSVISTNTVILPGISIGFGSLVGANSLVSRNVEPEKFALGSPAKIIGSVDMIKLRNEKKGPAYPWYTHFNSNYPDGLADIYREKRIKYLE